MQYKTSIKFKSVSIFRIFEGDKLAGSVEANEIVVTSPYGAWRKELAGGVWHIYPIELKGGVAK